MDSADEKLTVENVDEQIEHYLSQSRISSPATIMPLARTIHYLQSIYVEGRRLEQAWARINNHVSALNVDNTPVTEELSTIQLAQEEKRPIPASGGVLSHSALYRTGKRSQRPFRWNWRTLGVSAAAAIILLAIFAWPIASYALLGTPIGNPLSSIHKGISQSQSIVDTSRVKVYNSQYFTIQYPANWVITQVTTGGAYQQTVQMRPSATSAVFVSIDVLSKGAFSADQLLHMDSDVKLGTLLKTSSVTYHGISWAVGIVERTGKLEVAYSNQGTPYRIEFGTTTGNFDAYMPVFNTMFASFHAQTTSVATSAATPTVTSTPGVVATPSPTGIPSPTIPLSGIKVYSGQYFKIQYPSNWVITQVTTGGTYQQTVQMRPSATSAVFVNIDVLPKSAFSADQLLYMDPDVKLGTLLSTSSVTYHGNTWNVGIVNLLDSVLNQSDKVEVAYSNQNIPYKIEFSAPQDMFNSYAQTFNTMFASFYSTS